MCFRLFANSVYVVLLFCCGMLGCTLLALGCRSKPASTKQHAAASASFSNFAPRAAEPLLFLPTSAYRASIFMDEAGIYVLTSSAVHRILVGKSTEKFPLDLGYGATMTAHGFLFWSRGALWEVAKHGGEARPAGEVPERPKALVASGDRFAWMQATKAGESRLFTIDRGKPRLLFAVDGQVETLAMIDDVIYFVQRSTPSSWRIGAQKLSGEAPHFSTPNPGRTPAFLASFGDQLYYQVSSGLRVVRLSADLKRETTLAENLVCSPMAVWARVYCAQLGGIVELTGDTHAARALLKNERQVITAIAANADRVAWLSDAGPDQLNVKVLRIGE